MKHDYLKWGALLFALVATASAEYELARAVGFNQWVAAAVPGALDIYTVRAMRAHRDVLAAVVAMIGVNAASHLVTASLLPVNVPLVVAVSAIAPLVLWRVHSLEVTTAPAEVTTEAAPQEAEQTAVEPTEVTAEVVTVERIEAPEVTTEVDGFDPLPVLGMTTSATTTGPGFMALADLGLNAIQWPPPAVEVTTEARDKVTTAAASETARQTVSAVVVTTPAELRKQARKLNAQLVAETGREVTIDRLRSELGLSRRDAVNLRREILEGNRS